MCTPSLSYTMPVVMCYSINACDGGGKKRGFMEKLSNVNCAAQYRYQKDVWGKGVKMIKIGKRKEGRRRISHFITSLIEKCPWPGKDFNT